MSNRILSIPLFIAGIALAILSMLADNLGLDTPGSFGLAQIQGMILAILLIMFGFYFFFWRLTNTHSIIRLDGLNMVDMSERKTPTGQPAAGQIPIEILDPRMLEQRRTPFVPGQAWRIIERKDQDGEAGGGD